MWGGGGGGGGVHEGNGRNEGISTLRTYFDQTYDKQPKLLITNSETPIKAIHMRNYLV